jgi:membrane-associated phospholipid phosphatase
LAFWVLALVVGLARVYAGVHHVLDITGSLVIAAVALGIYLLARMLWEKRQGSQSAR